jgi:hypothetical protein
MEQLEKEITYFLASPKNFFNFSLVSLSKDDLTIAVAEKANFTLTLVKGNQFKITSDTLILEAWCLQISNKLQDYQNISDLLEFV